MLPTVLFPAYRSASRPFPWSRRAPSYTFYLFPCAPAMLAARTGLVVTKDACLRVKESQSRPCVLLRPSLIVLAAVVRFKFVQFDWR